jgi:orotate phosphoribosyltransferase
MSTGGAVSGAAALVRATGTDVIAVICAIWRRERPIRIVGEPDLPVFSAFTRESFSKSTSPKGCL